MFVNQLAQVIVRTEFHTSYVPADDVTIVWQNLLVGDELVQRQLVGWYCGEPDPAVTKQYTNMPLTAQFTD